MPIEVREKFDSRRLTKGQNPSAELAYIVLGTDDEEQIADTRLVERRTGLAANLRIPFAALAGREFQALKRVMQARQPEQGGARRIEQKAQRVGEDVDEARRRLQRQLCEARKSPCSGRASDRRRGRDFG